MTQVRSSAPGKLYIAGEYAVVDGCAAIVAAVNRYVTVSVSDETLNEELRENLQKNTPSSRNYCGVITSDGEKYKPLLWARASDGSIEIQNDGKYAYVLAAMSVVDAYASEECAPNINRKSYNVHISSELDDAKTGRKYGLGSSAAVIVAVIRALCKWYDLNLSTPEICKLALIASSSVKKSGSGGDVAASSYGGWIMYRAYNREWLEAELTLVKSGCSDFSELLHKKWPRLEVKRLNADKSLKLLVGWTGSPASSAKLVSSVESSVKTSTESNVESNAESSVETSAFDKKIKSFTYEDFCKQSEICVQKLAHAIEKFEISEISSGFAQNRALLQKLSALTGTVIETRELAKFIEIATCAGIPAKTSGAGGGDCAIALSTIYDNNVIETMKSTWEANGIKPLNIDVTEIFGTGKPSENIVLNAFAEGREPNAQSAQSCTIQNRKDAHIALADKQYKTRADSDFDKVRFVPNALPQVALEEIDASVNVLGSEVCDSVHWCSPIYINAMTGGSDAAKKVNASLARVAAKNSVAMASGSLSAALRDETLLSTFSVIRSENPHGFVMANVSAGTSASDALRAVNMIQANALQVHLNAAQELVMQEGDRDFRNWLRNIESIVNACEDLKVPVIVKETGCGISAKDVHRLKDVGVRTVDVSGRGGTNFVTIENARRNLGDCDYLADWGLTTVESLVDIRKCDSLKNMEIFASGGVRTPLDVVRALALGASAVGVAGEFLHTLMHEGEDALSLQIDNWQKQIKMIMALLGCKTVKDLQEKTEFVRADCLGK
ncbi:type 2 isopentenyl-diphosphate Delta-isomerase [Gardnerella sp. DNF00983]|uniref:type 2 isopentenyl-diphosphate Delta-isomerase n=1 Tax=unclassified Gardnerella TaxID=2628112 RepID=UPI003BACFBA9